MQFKSLHIKPSFFEDYFRDSIAISKDNMIAFPTANADYKMKNSITDCTTEVIVLVGSKEKAIMKKSAKIINSQIQDSSFEILQNYYHGDLSINHAELYSEKILLLTGYK